MNGVLGSAHSENGYHPYGPVRTGSRGVAALPVSVPPSGAHSDEPDVPQQTAGLSGPAASVGDALRKSEARLRLALTATGQGMYDLDLRAGVAAVTPEYMEMLGEDSSRATIDLSSFGERVHPDDLERVSGLIDAYTRGDIDEYRDEFRLLHASGEWIWVLSIGRVVERDEMGRALRVLGSHTDITERRRSDEALRESQRMLSTLISNSPGVVYRCRNDRDWTMEFLSDGVERLTGYPAADFVGTPALRSFEQVMHPNDRQSSRDDAIRENAAAGRPYQVTYRIVSSSGDTRWVWEQGRGVVEDGELVALEGVITDITSRVDAERELTRAEDYAKRLIDTANAMVVGLDGSGEIVEFNRAAELTTGYSRSELAGRNWFDVICPRDRYPGVWNEFLRLSTSGLPSVFENRILTKSGDERYIVWSNSEVRTGPDAIGTISFGIDVTEQRAAARALEETSAMLRSIIDGTSDSVYVKDSGGRYLLFNDAACRIVGKQADEVLGQDDTALFPPEEARVIMHGDRGVMEMDETLTHEENATGADGVRRTYSSTKGPIHDATGAVVGLFGIARDITERALMEERIRELIAELEQRVAERTEQLAWANEGLEGLNQELTATNEELARVIQGLEETNRRLDEATRAKSEFLANMSHELRTPLNSIIGFSGILRQGLAGQLTDEQSKQVQMISTAGQHLLNLINEILDLASIEAGGVHLRLERFSARDAAVLVAQTMRPLAEQKGLEIEWDHDAPDVWMTSDPTRLEQIVLNLLSNAVKFTDVGRIVLQVSAAPDGATITVSDSGRGVPPEDAERIFEDFYQGIAMEGGKHAGTGLGLSVSRRLARMLGGDIEVDSSLGRGSTFTLRLPNLSAADAHRSE